MIPTPPIGSPSSPIRPTGPTPTHGITLPTNGTSGPSITAPKAITGNEQEPPKCFGTDYFGKWNSTGMTFESMRIDRPDQQSKCANCNLFSRCYELNHIRLLKIKH